MKDALIAANDTVHDGDGHLLQTSQLVRAMCRAGGALPEAIDRERNHRDQSQGHEHRKEEGKDHRLGLISQNCVGQRCGE